MELSSPLKIKRIVAGGWGLTHMGPKATFVRGVLPDEMVTLTPVESVSYTHLTLPTNREV